MTNKQITANSIKADVRIVDFPWTQSNSHVALLSNVKSKLELDIDDQDEDDELDTVVDAGEEQPVDEIEVEPTADELLPTTNEEESPWMMECDDLWTVKPIKPKDVTVSFSDVVNTVGFSPFGTVAWAEMAV
jgi:hypothetical protein